MNVFVDSFALPEGRPDAIIGLPDGHPTGTIAPPEKNFNGVHVPRATPPFEPNGVFDPCPFKYGSEWKLIELWCLSPKMIEARCWRNVGTYGDNYFQVYGCLPFTYCVGQQKTDPEPRWAHCKLDFKPRLRWITNKLSSSSVLQCVNFDSGGATGADGVGVQVDNPAVPPTEQPMPQQAQLFYQGSVYSIQAIGQNLMDDMSSFFIFEDVIDYTQALQLCVNVATAAIALNIGLINPKGADMAGLTFDTANETVYRKFDAVTGVWREVELDGED